MPAANSLIQNTLKRQNVSHLTSIQALPLRQQARSWTSHHPLYSLSRHRRKPKSFRLYEPNSVCFFRHLPRMDSTSVALNEVERLLRQLLLDVVEFIEKNPVPPTEDGAQVEIPNEVSKEPLQLRFTGGWVRDKLLKVHSQDIDVAINRMTGYQFGLRLKDYLDAPGNAKKYGLEGHSKKAGSLSKIEANPEKSKHLETVTTKILGLDIDLVNLRKETYTETSRNPQMEFGTPEEDAMRRDATINAMFYNIHTSKVEDFTKRGLDDLRDGIIRTPLEPRTTFVDDPLRVLRLIRFATRLDYKIDDDVKKAMADEEIKKALLIKITRERVWMEIEKTLKGPGPYQALKYIDTLNLYGTIFTDPAQSVVYTPELENWPATYNALNSILSARESGPQSIINSIVIQTEEDKFHAWLLASLIPWADAPELPPLKSGKPAPAQAINVAREGLKTPNKFTDILLASLNHMEEINQLKDKKASSRDVLGMSIRNWGATWRLQVVFALLYEIYANPEREQAVMKEYAEMLKTIESLGILEAYALKPLIDGKTLANALSTPPGLWMKSALDVVTAWQLRNPDITDPLAAIAEVKAWKQQQQDMGQDGRSSTTEKSTIPPKKRKKQGELISALTSHFLHLTLRPLFSQTRHPDLTITGRRKLKDGASTRFQSDSLLPDSDAQPWKGPQAWALDLLYWICANLDSDCVEREWGVLIPPILTVLDDTDVKIKTRGCEFLTMLLEATPPDFLKRTGLAPVFEESLFTCMTYLPTLTPESESVAIIEKALPALLALADTWFPSSDEAVHSPARSKFLLKILRKGFLLAYNHAGDNVQIALTLQNQLPRLLDALGIDSVIHLKDLLPMLSRVLDDPLGPSSPPLLLGATKSLEAVLFNAWPRIPFWRGEVVKGLCGCWLRIDGEKGDQFDELRAELKTLAKILDAVMVASEEEAKWKEERASLILANNRLEDLFGELKDSKEKGIEEPSI